MRWTWARARCLAAVLAGVAVFAPVSAPAEQQSSPDTPVPAWAQASYDAYLQMKAKAHGGTRYTPASFAKMPDWSGIWERVRDAPGAAPDSTSLARLGTSTADLTPRYRAAYLLKIYNSIAEGNQWDQLSDCLPSSFPRVLGEPFSREFVLRPEQTWWIEEQVSEVRRFYTDGRGHIPMNQASPLWEGDTIGFWDGDTLVAHTLYVTHSEYRRVNPDYSAELSAVERIRKIDPNTIEDRMTVWDPKGLRKPWPIRFIYRRDTTPDQRVNYWSCDANNNVIRTATGGSTFILPGETVMMKRSYREPQSFYLSDVQKRLFLTGDPITLNAKQKAWLNVHLIDPERYRDLLGPMTKQEEMERVVVQKTLMERQPDAPKRRADE